MTNVSTLTFRYFRPVFERVKRKTLPIKIFRQHRCTHTRAEKRKEKPHWEQRDLSLGAPQRLWRRWLWLSQAFTPKSLSVSTVPLDLNLAVLLCTNTAPRWNQTEQWLQLSLCNLLPASFDVSASVALQLPDQSQTMPPGGRTQPHRAIEMLVATLLKPERMTAFQNTASAKCFLPKVGASQKPHHRWGHTSASRAWVNKGNRMPHGLLGFLKKALCFCLF